MGTTEDEMVGWYHRLSEHEFKLRDLVMGGKAWHAAVHGVVESETTEHLSTICIYLYTVVVE